MRASLHCPGLDSLARLPGGTIRAEQKLLLRYERKVGSKGSPKPRSTNGCFDSGLASYPPVLYLVSCARRLFRFERTGTPVEALPRPRWMYGALTFPRRRAEDLQGKLLWVKIPADIVAAREALAASTS